MGWAFDWYSAPLWITAAIAGLLVAFAWRFSAMPGVRAFLLLMLSVFIWSLGYGLEIAVPGFSQKIFWAKVQYLGIVSVPTFWLVYTIYFTGNTAWLSLRNRRLLHIFPLATLFLAWTNDWHGLIWQKILLNELGLFPDLSYDYGYWFWANILYSYLLMLAGTVVIIRFMVHSQGLFREQARNVLVAALFPWLGNAIYLAGLSPIPEMDLTPFAFTLTGLMIAWGVLRLQFLDLVPLARDTVVESMSDAVFVIDAWDRVVDINPAALALFPGNKAIIGKHAADLLREPTNLYDRFKDVREAREVFTVIRHGSEKFYELRISPLKDPQANFSGRLVVLQDITERELSRRLLQKANDELEQRVQDRTQALEAANQRLMVEIAERRAAQEALYHQTLHDVLTGLPNRKMFLDRLDQAFERSKRHPGHAFAVLFLDLDRFKEVNDNLGHNTGDQLLIAIGERLKPNLRAVDTLARMAGDEFAILMDETNDARDVIPVVERILEEFSTPFDVNGHLVHTSASIGIALAEKTYQSSEEILHAADAAMYQAKAEGPGRYVVI